MAAIELVMTTLFTVPESKLALRIDSVPSLAGSITSLASAGSVMGKGLAVCIT